MVSWSVVRILRQNRMCKQTLHFASTVRSSTTEVMFFVPKSLPDGALATEDLPRIAGTLVVSHDKHNNVPCIPRPYKCISRCAVMLSNRSQKSVFGFGREFIP